MSVSFHTGISLSDWLNYNLQHISENLGNGRKIIAILISNFDVSPQAVFEELKIHTLPELLSSWPLSHMMTELLDLLFIFSGPLQSSFGPCAVQVTASVADKCPMLLQLPLLPQPLMVTYTDGSNFPSKGGIPFFMSRF